MTIGSIFFAFSNALSSHTPPREVFIKIAPFFIKSKSLLTKFLVWPFSNCCQGYRLIQCQLAEEFHLMFLIYFLATLLLSDLDLLILLNLLFFKSGGSFNSILK